MTPEEIYRSEVEIEHRKKFAQFFTPDEIADFMCSWLMTDESEESEKTLLEPAFGLGIFTRKLRKSFSRLKIKAYDIDQEIFKRANNLFKDDAGLKLSNEDFLRTSWKDSFDFIVCNPPYLKFHDYDNNFHVKELNRNLSLKLRATSNIYTLFLLKSISQLKDGGKLAFIVPSEFLNSDYGVEVKRFLAGSKILEHVIVIDYGQNAFEGVITTACILLCHKKGKCLSVKFSLAKDLGELSQSLFHYREIGYDEIDPEVKWRKYYEDVGEGRYFNLVPFSTFAKVSRGIATGANDYFIFNQSKADAYSIPPECLLPCICRSADVTDSFFTQKKFLKLKEQDKKIYIFNGASASECEEVRRYLQKGEEEEIDKRYLTSCRTPWYAMENRKPAPIWVGVFNRVGLKFIRNEAGIYNLTTFHCVYPNRAVDIRILFVYLLTDLAKEIFTENARQYGNGLVKFEPNDLNKGKAVDLRLLKRNERSVLIKAYAVLESEIAAEKELVYEIDKLFRQIYSGNSPEEEIKKISKMLREYSHIFSDPPETKSDGEGIFAKGPYIEQLSLF